MKEVYFLKKPMFEPDLYIQFDMKFAELLSHDKLELLVDGSVQW